MRAGFLRALAIFFVDLILLVAIVGLFGCSDTESRIAEPPPLSVAPASAPVVGQAVIFRVLESRGSVFAGVNITTDSGIARERWLLCTLAGQVLEARAVDSDRDDEEILELVSSDGAIAHVWDLRTVFWCAVGP